MAFEPRYRLIPRILRQLKAIERTAGMFEAVRMKPEWITFFLGGFAYQMVRTQDLLRNEMIHSADSTPLE
jgi:hypothetical protein